ncbi:undecaprenyl-phosphate glucose phosphotransferase [Cyclobacterium sp. SYSU L10401]|nr:undecaprenyl-phosphate glucose phosphotransferase [Cyclobacterium sp. SYSU L10401]
MTKSDQQLAFLYFAVDLFLLIGCFLTSQFFFGPTVFPGRLEWVVLLSIMVLWIGIGYFRRLYFIHLHNSIRYRLVNYIKSYFILLGIISIAYLVTRVYDKDRNLVMAFVIGFPVISLLVNIFLIKLISNLRRKGINIRNTIIIGVGQVAAKMDHYFKSNPDLGYAISGFVYADDEKVTVPEKKIIGNLSQIHHLIEFYQVDEVIIALPYHSSSKIKIAIKAADYHGIRVKYVPDYYGLFGGPFKITRYGELDVLNVRQISLDEIYASFFKRVFDIFFSLGVMVLLSPLFLWIAFKIQQESPGPIFYKPIRVGRSGKAIKVYKFRSMVHCDDQKNGTQSTVAKDPRITKIGRFLRKYSLDELPQFYNVLKGDMSVVGPRPHRSYLNQKMQEEVSGYMIRHYLKPGITGWAQVNGWRGPTETEEQRKERTKHDLWYLENWSIWLDFKIIWLTIFGKKTHQKAF